MNQVNVFKILQSHGFDANSAQDLITALEENKELATKQDILQVKVELKEVKIELKEDIHNLKSDIQKLEIRMMEKMDSLTWKILGGMSVIVAVTCFVLKLMEIVKS